MGLHTVRIRRVYRFVDVNKLLTICQQLKNKNKKTWENYYLGIDYKIPAILVMLLVVSSLTYL